MELLSSVLRHLRESPSDKYPTTDFTFTRTRLVYYHDDFTGWMGERPRYTTHLYTFQRDTDVVGFDPRAVALPRPSRQRQPQLVGLSPIMVVLWC
ncbi:hypothetical protein Pmani_016780 [Petrolisthes manimaculis]|uniref:Uncharacterized protein n=1 Tax=Petrolisthes manimaculis TaxID=1843537 RepID=A0AAE1UAM5_9EUCA|nr:hypothetical protein Pmani_016780 [Petrolisthes manimaculis]